MRVSVILPTYNRGYILAEALDSVLKQSYEDFELIVVDDGSTDNTADLVRSVQSEKIRYIRHQRNCGVSAALNSGVSAASGEFIGFLGSDDLWKPEKLERQINFLCRHPEVDFVFSDVEIVVASEVIPSIIGLMKSFPKFLEGKLRGEEYILSGREMYLCLLQELPIKPTASLIKRDVFARVGMFDETWRSGEDWEHLLRLSPGTCFGYMNVPLASMRQMADATHLVYREQDKLFLLKLFMREKARLRGDREALRAVNRGISNHCNNLAWYYLLSGKRVKSVSVYFRGFRETGEPRMLLRAASALIPLSLRGFLRRAVGKAHL